MLHLVSTTPIPSPPVATTKSGPDGDDPLLAFAGPIRGVHALVLAGSGPDLFCDLIRHGCLAATLLRTAAKPEAGVYDLMLAPRVTTASPPSDLAQQARRALAPTGRLVARVTRDPSGRAARALTRALKLNGFVAVRAHVRAGETLLRADLPAFHMAASA